MARTITQIQEQITTTYVNNMAAAGVVVDPSTWSLTNLERIFIYAIAFCIHALELIFDTHQQETLEDLANLKPHTERWYAKKALAYQHGFNLLPDSDQYDNTGFTDAQIEESKVVKYSAVIEQENQFGRVFLRIKLAGSDGNDLTQLTAPEFAGFKEYMKRVKDAGVKLQEDNLPADKLKMKWTIYYDPLILDNTGSRLDGAGGTVVANAVKEYLRNLPFNGVYVLQYHEDFLQAVPGVVIAEISECQTSYGLLPYTSVNVKTTPDAGYLRFYDDADLEITFIAQTPIR
jgi:hypothetical protein